jgi:hypothetical protein
VINPYEITPRKSNGVPSPDIFGVELSDVDISGSVSLVLVIDVLSYSLDYDILRPVCNPKTFTSDHARASNAYDGLIRGNVDW